MRGNLGRLPRHRGLPTEMKLAQMHQASPAWRARNCEGRPVLTVQFTLSGNTRDVWLISETVGLYKVVNVVPADADGEWAYFIPKNDPCVIVTKKPT